MTTDLQPKKSQDTSKEHYQNYIEIKGYIPTPCEMDLLDVKLNPDNRHLEVQEICKLAGISKPTYFRAFYKPQFREYYNTLFMAHWQDKADLMMSRVFECGMKYERCASDRRLFLEAVGSLPDKKEININKKSVNVDMEFGKVTTADVKSFLIEMAKNDPNLLKQLNAQLTTTEEIIEAEVTEVNDNG